MKYFAVYHAATGKIVRAGACQDHMVAAQAHADGEAAIETGRACSPESERVNPQTRAVERVN